MKDYCVQIDSISRRQCVELQDLICGAQCWSLSWQPQPENGVKSAYHCGANACILHMLTVA